MTCETCQRLQLDLDHVMRRLAQRPVDYSQKVRNGELVSLFDKATQYKIERNNALRENGELRATIVLLTDMLEERCA